VANNEYIERLKLTIEHLHKCSAVHVLTVPVNEQFKGQSVWQGEVEVFTLFGHPKARQCYAWSHADGQDDSKERIVTVLQIPPVQSAETAIRASIMADGQKG
jgi:hypothetical protein